MRQLVRLHPLNRRHVAGDGLRQLEEVRFAVQARSQIPQNPFPGAFVELVFQVQEHSFVRLKARDEFFH